MNASLLTGGFSPEKPLHRIRVERARHEVIFTTLWTLLFGLVKYQQRGYEPGNPITFPGWYIP